MQFKRQVFAESYDLRTSFDIFAELYQIASDTVSKVISGILGALAEFTFLGAFVHFKVLGALEEVKIARALVEFKF